MNKPIEKNLYGIPDDKKTFYSYEFKDGKPQPATYGTDNLIARRRLIPDDQARSSIMKLLNTKLKQSPYYCYASGATNEHRVQLIQRFFNLREKIIEQLIIEGVLKDKRDANPLWDTSTRVYINPSYEYLENKDMRQKMVNAISNAKETLGSLYSDLKVNPNLPFGMPIIDKSYDDKSFIDDGVIGIMRQDKSCDYIPVPYTHINIKLNLKECQKS